MNRLLVLVPHCRDPSHSSVKDREVTIIVLSIISPSSSGNLSPTSLALDVKKGRKKQYVGESLWCVVWQSDMLMFLLLGNSWKWKGLADWLLLPSTGKQEMTPSGKPELVQPVSHAEAATNPLLMCRGTSVSRMFSDAGYKPRWKNSEDKQCHPMELEQRERESSAMGGLWGRAPKGHKPKRAPEQGTVPTGASAKTLLTLSDGKSSQLSSREDYFVFLGWTASMT